MQTINSAHLLFEQSGTFKSAFNSLGVSARSYDIENQYGQTDIQIDIFQEIDNFLVGKQSIFDNFSACDIVFAFFPCTYFCENNAMYFTGVHRNLQKCRSSQKIQKIIYRAEQRHYFYIKLLQLIEISRIIRFSLVIENPYNKLSYLYQNIPIDDIIFISDRRKLGDFFKKSTAFFCYNFLPKHPVLQSELVRSINKKVEKIGYGSERSEMSLEFAVNFIKTYIL